MHIGDRDGHQGPSVSVVIVSYNTRELTLDCLRTLFRFPVHSPLEVWVVDNASTDGSVEAIKKTFPDVHVIASETNLGFGTANNRAMSRATGRYFLLLNSDAFVHEGSVDNLVVFLENNSRVGVVGPRLLNDDGTLQPSCFRFPSPSRAWLENLWIPRVLEEHEVWGDYRTWSHDQERRVDFVSGACFLVRREVFEQTGGFDEQFFMYAEEADWQRRITDGGWEITFTPTSQVKHLGGASGGSERVLLRKSFFDSLDRYELKHHGTVGLLSLRLAMTVGCSLRSALWAGVMVASSSKRQHARDKLHLHSWLVRRQLTNWSALRSRV